MLAILRKFLTRRRVRRMGSSGRGLGTLGSGDIVPKVTTLGVGFSTHRYFTLLFGCEPLPTPYFFRHSKCEKSHTHRHVTIGGFKLSGGVEAGAVRLLVVAQDTGATRYYLQLQRALLTGAQGAEKQGLVAQDEYQTHTQALVGGVGKAP